MAVKPTRSRAFLRATAVQLPLLMLLLTTAVTLGSLAIVVVRMQENGMIEALATGHDVPVDVRATPAVVMARAKFLLDHEAADEAQPLIQSVTESGSKELAVAGVVKRGDARMQRAVKLIADGKFDTATADVVLAKDFYVRALRVDPNAWDVKYNLDVAMRLVRDFPDTMIPADDRRLQPKKLWTDLPGLPKGEP